jgi:hypothetical protein
MAPAEPIEAVLAHALRGGASAPDEPRSASAMAFWTLTMASFVRSKFRPIKNDSLTGGARLTTGRDAPTRNASRFIVVRDMRTMINLRLGVAIIVFWPAAFLVGGYKPTAAEPAQGPDGQDRAGSIQRARHSIPGGRPTQARVIVMQDMPGPRERTLLTG